MTLPIKHVHVSIEKMIKLMFLLKKLLMIVKKFSTDSNLNVYLSQNLIMQHIAIQNILHYQKNSKKIEEINEALE